MADEEPPIGDDTTSTKDGAAEVQEVEEPGVSDLLEESEKPELEPDEIEEDQHAPDANRGTLEATGEDELVHEETSDEAPSHKVSAQVGEDTADELHKSLSTEPVQVEGEENQQNLEEETADMDRKAQYAEPSKEDIDDDADEPAAAAEMDREDEDADDEVGAYATPLSPDSVLDVMKEQPAEAPECDEADVVPDELGPTCPGVPPPPALFVDAARDGLRTPPRESTLANVLVINQLNNCFHSYSFIEIIVMTKHIYVTLLG